MELGTYWKLEDGKSLRTTNPTITKDPVFNKVVTAHWKEEGEHSLADHFLHFIMMVADPNDLRTRMKRTDIKRRETAVRCLSGINQAAKKRLIEGKYQLVEKAILHYKHLQARDGRFKEGITMDTGVAKSLDALDKFEEELQTLLSDPSNLEEIGLTKLQIGFLEPDAKARLINKRIDQAIGIVKSGVLTSIAKEKRELLYYKGFLPEEAQIDEDELDNTIAKEEENGMEDWMIEQQEQDKTIDY